MRIPRIILYLIFILSPITSKATDKDVITQQRGLVAKGDSCFNAYDYFHALQYYKQLDTTFVNNNLPVVRNMAEIYHRTGNNKAWFNTLVHVYSSQPDSMTYNDMRSLFFASRSIEWDDFITMIGNKILKTNPYDSETNLGVMRQYGYAAHLLGNSKVALETYKKLEVNGFDNYESALIIGYSLLKLDSAWNARPYLRKAVEKRKEGEYASLLHLGNAYIACGEYGEGIGCLYEVIEAITPKNDLYYSLYNSIGEAYYKQKIYEKAAKAFLECTKYKSDNPLVYYNIAQMCKGMKDEKREIKYSKKFLDISHHLEDTPQNKELIKSVEERVEYLSKHVTK